VLGIGACVPVGEIVSTVGYPFRMMWFTPLFGSPVAGTADPGAVRSHGKRARRRAMSLFYSVAYRLGFAP